MSNIINQNLDEIISIKNQLSNVLIENGVEAGNRFSDYPDMFRSVIASGGGFNPSYYYTADEIDENFVSYSYATANYVSYSYAYNTFVSYSYLGTLEDITEYILGSGSSSAPENVYATKTELGAYATKVELGSYVSKIELSNASYVTSSDLPVINENIVPKSTDTYFLGDTSNYYHSTYTNRIRGNSSVNFVTGGNNRLTVTGTAFRPMQQNYNLGSSDYPFATAYTSNLYSGNIVLSNTYNSIVNVNNTRINFQINQNNRFKMTNVEFAPVNNNGVNLGTSSEKFSKTYTSTLYADTAYSTRYNFTYNTWIGSDSDYEFHIGVNNQKRYQMNMYQFYQVTNPDSSSLGVPGYPWAYTYTKFLIGQNAYISNVAYLPVNTYWYDGSTYHWLGDLFN